MEMENHAVSNLEKPSTNLPTTSLRERSTSAIRAAIHLPQDQGETLRRINVALGLGYVPDEDDQTKADLRADFLRVLDGYANWAVQAAFDTWMRTMSRRPSPAEMVIHVERELKPMFDELAYRRKIQEAQAEEARRIADNRVAGDVSQRLMHDAGFTPKRMDAIRASPMATTFSEAETRVHEPRKPHWTETADPEGPDMKRLQADRDASPHVIAARKHQAEVARQDAARQRLEAGGAS